jgi:hypothetical protein
MISRGSDTYGHSTVTFLDDGDLYLITAFGDRKAFALLPSEYQHNFLLLLMSRSVF